MTQSTLATILFGLGTAAGAFMTGITHGSLLHGVAWTTVLAGAAMTGATAVYAWTSDEYGPYDPHEFDDEGSCNELLFSADGKEVTAVLTDRQLAEHVNACMDMLDSI